MGLPPSVQPSKDNHTPQPNTLPVPEDQTMDTGRTLVSAGSRLQAGMGIGHNGSRLQAGIGTGHESSSSAVNETGFITTRQSVLDHSSSLSEEASQSSKASHGSLHLTLEENNLASGLPPPLPFSSISSSQSQHEQ